MARGRNALYWKIHQSLGQYRITDAGKGESIISMKGGTPTFIDPADEETRDIRIKGFSGSGHLSSVLKTVIDLGFREAKSPKFPVNLFVEANALTLCTERRDENGKLVKEYNYAAMQVAGGTLDPVDVTVTYTADARKFQFEQDGEVLIGGRAYPDDRVYACVFESARERVALVDLRVRGESGSTSFALPAGWDVAKVFIYVFANAARKRWSSSSVRVYPAPTADELLDARLAELQEEERRMQETARQDAIADRKQRMIDAMLSAREAGAKAREEALAAGKTRTEAHLEGERVYDSLMETAREAEDTADEAAIEAEMRRETEQREREEAARQKARERRKAIAARLAAEREEERELRRLEKEEKKRKLEEARKKKGE